MKLGFFYLVVVIFVALCPWAVMGATVPELEATLLNAIVKAFTATDKCAKCQTLVAVFQLLAAMGNQVFIDVVTGLCTKAKINSASVCQGAINSEGPILIQSLLQMNTKTHTSTSLCNAFFGLCDAPAVRNYTVPMIAPLVNRTKPDPSGKTPLKVLHITDTHVDLDYTTGSSYNCSEPICCRAYSPDLAPGNNSYPAGPYGNTKCDPPKILEDSMYEGIKQLVPDAAFTIFTGDVPAHDIWLITKQEVLTDLHSTYDTMKKNLKTVYPAVGNHETYPVNSFAPARVISNYSADWVYNTLNDEWKPWLGDSHLAEEFGAYSYKVPDQNLRIISINTNFYYQMNFVLYQRWMEYDPSGQFQWLVQQLQTAETFGQRVWIIGHIPMGGADTFVDGSNYFGQILKRYENTIAAIFFGHTHKDEFEIAYNNYYGGNYTKRQGKDAFAVYYITGSMTPLSGNPTFKMFSIDPVTYSVLDFTVYYADMYSESYQTGPTWSKLYSAKEAYGTLLNPPVVDPEVELDGEFWHNLTEVFLTNDTAFQQYYKRKSRDYFNDTCTGSCKEQEICQLRAGEAAYNCNKVKPGINFDKRSLPIPDTTHIDECSSSLLIPSLKSIADNSTLLEAVLANTLGKEILHTPLSQLVPSTYQHLLNL